MSATKIKPSNIDTEALIEFLRSNNFIISEAPIDFIAKASTTIDNDGKEKLIDGTTLIDSALNLAKYTDDGKINYISANDVVTTQELDGKIENQNEFNNSSTSDVISLRSELYTLIDNLSKTGIFKSYNIENGFIDSFNSSNIKYAKQNILTVTELSKSSNNCVDSFYIDHEDADKIIPKCWYIAKFQKNGAACNKLFYVKNKVAGEAIKTKIEIDPALLVDGDTTHIDIKNINGQYYSNTFSFSLIDANYATGDISEASFESDTDYTYKTAIDSTTNFAFAYKIPNNKYHNIKSLTLYASLTNFNTSLDCYIAKSSILNSTDGKSVAEKYISNDSDVICKSKTFNITNDLLKSAWSTQDQHNYKITFDFSDENGKYLTSLDLSEKYVFIVAPSSSITTNNSKCELLFSGISGSDIESFNKCYKYSSADGGVNYSFTPYTEDVMFSIVTIKVDEYKETGYTDGLYTSEKFTIDNKCNNIQLSLIVNREGSLLSANGVIQSSDNDQTLYNTITYEGSNDSIAVNDTIIVGNNIFTVIDNKNGLKIRTDVDISVNNGDKIYRIAYEPILILFDESGGYDSYKLSLSDIHKAPSYAREDVSDKLIFTSSEINGAKKYASGFISIAWRGNESKNGINIGRIYNLEISTSSINSSNTQ